MVKIRLLPRRYTMKWNRKTTSTLWYGGISRRSWSLANGSVEADNNVLLGSFSGNEIHAAIKSVFGVQLEIRQSHLSIRCPRSRANQFAVLVFYKVRKHVGFFGAKNRTAVELPRVRPLRTAMLRATLWTSDDEKCVRTVFVQYWPGNKMKISYSAVTAILILIGVVWIQKHLISQTKAFWCTARAMTRYRCRHDIEHVLGEARRRLIKLWLMPPIG